MDPRLQRQQAAAQKSAQDLLANSSQQKVKSIQIDTNQGATNPNARQEGAPSKQKIAEGPVKRNPHLQESESDCFQPRFQLSYGLPEIPVRPKLFKYRLDTRNTTNYEFTTVELNQEHQILVDYNLGVRVDLIDRGVYGSKFGEGNLKMAEDTFTLNERDKFLLSDKETLPKLSQLKQPNFQPQRSQPELDFQRQAHIEDQVEEDDHEPVYSGSGAQGGKENQKIASEQIERTFDRVQKFVVGASKPGNPLVTAVSVTEILPSTLAGIVAQFSVVLNEDDLGRKVSAASEFANGLMLHGYEDAEGEHRKALYAGNQKQVIDEALQSQILGKRSRLQRKYSAIQQQHFRDYTFNEVKGGTKGEKFDYVLVKVGDTLQYVPVISKIKLNKKRQAHVEVDSDGEPVLKHNRQVTNIVIAPRGLSAEDRMQMLKQMSFYGLQEARIPDSQISFADKDEVTNIEQIAALQLKALFKVQEEPAQEQLENDGDQLMREQNSEGDDIFEPSQDEPSSKHPVEISKQESVVSEDDIF